MIGQLGSMGLSDSAKYSAMKAATINLAVPNSTEMIVREIAALLPQNKTVAVEAMRVGA